MKQRMIEAINAQLTAKGLQLATGNADLAVAAHVATQQRSNWPSAMESSTASSVSTPFWNPVALFRLCSTSRFPINGRSFDPHAESVYTSISSSWTVISA